MTAAKFAYAVVATERRADPGLDLSHAPAAPAIGDIQVFDVPQGGETIIQEQDYDTKGALVDIVHLAYVGTGRDNGDGPGFEYETRRLLALIQIGARNEYAVHNLVDQIFERFEEVMARTVGDRHGEEIGDALEALRKEFP